MKRGAYDRRVPQPRHVRDVNGIDWCDCAQVVRLARSLGPGMTVFKHPNRPNYNITHTSRPDRLEGVEVIYRT